MQMRSELISIAKLDTLASLCGPTFTFERRFIFSVSIKHGLRTADYGLRTEYKIWTRYKTRTGKYGLGIKHGLGIKRGLRTTDWV